MADPKTPKTPKTPTTHKPVSPERPSDAALALVAVRPELAALPAEDVMVIRVDVPYAASTALAAIPKIKAFRAEVVDQLPRHPIATFDKLETYALGAWFAHLSATRGEDRVKALVQEATPLRQGLLVAAEALAHRGVFGADRVADIRSGHGHVDLANDLVELGAMFTAAWPKVQSKTAVEEAEVRRASVLGPELLTALGMRDQDGSAGTTEPDGSDTRARAFTLFVRAYDACRQALVYLRWHAGDVDTIAPSLFRLRPGRGGKKSKVEEEGAAGEDAPHEEGLAAPAGNVAAPAENGAAAPVPPPLAPDGEAPQGGVV